MMRSGLDKLTGDTQPTGSDSDFPLLDLHFLEPIGIFQPTMPLIEVSTGEKTKQRTVQLPLINFHPELSYDSIFSKFPKEFLIITRSSSSCEAKPSSLSILFSSSRWLHLSCMKLSSDFMFFSSFERKAALFAIDTASCQILERQ
jgi:hypothetical protein